MFCSFPSVTVSAWMEQMSKLPVVLGGAVQLCLGHNDAQNYKLSCALTCLWVSWLSFESIWVLWQVKTLLDLLPMGLRALLELGGTARITQQGDVSHGGCTFLITCVGAELCLPSCRTQSGSCEALAAISRYLPLQTPELLWHLVHKCHS